MQLTYSAYKLNCIHPFGISRSTHDYYDVVYISLKGEGFTGRGEAAPSARYEESAASILSCLKAGLKVPEVMADPISFTNILIGQCRGIKALEAALSMAIMDWWCQFREIPVYKYFGADPDKTPLTSFTISLGDRKLLSQKIEEAGPYSILKVKLGQGIKKDKEIITAIRAETDKLIRVDANEGWDLDSALYMCSWLKDNNVEFVEQPFKARNLADTVKLRRVSPLRLIADENSLTAGDIKSLRQAFDGINIKLMKCGSLFEAMEMIKAARYHGLKIMLGCMVESSLGITAAAHLSPLVDYADLDGNLLINNDPYSGVKVVEGRLVLPTRNGLGVKKLPD